MPELPAPPPLRWAVVGPGRIAQRFAEAVNALPDAELTALCGRDRARGEAFAARWARPGRAPAAVCTELSALLARDDVDAVYIATPHSEHAHAVCAALRAGRPVLCEKPLAPTQAIAAELVALAQQRGLFLMEALWTRFLPAYDVVGGWLRAQAVGPLRRLQSSFCFVAPYDPASRLYDPALAGGALLDIGIYNLAVTRWALQQAGGSCPPLQRLQVQGERAPSGVELRVAATLVFEGGVVSQLDCGFDSTSANALHIEGEQGRIVLPRDFWQATEAHLQRHGEPVRAVQAPFRVNGFEGEIEEAMRCVRAGRGQSERMPHADTLATLGWIDTLRRQLGLRFPFE